MTDLRPTRHVYIRPAPFWAMPSARAAAASRWSLLRVSSIASIAIAGRFLRHNAVALILGFIAGVLAVLIPAMVIAQVIA